MLVTILTLLEDGGEAFQALQQFLATPAGKDLEAKLAALFTVTATPGGSVVIEPLATTRQMGRASIGPDINR